METIYDLGTKMIDALTKEKAELDEHFHKEIAELESLVETRIFREDELETEMEKMRKERDEARDALDRLKTEHDSPAPDTF